MTTNTGRHRSRTRATTLPREANSLTGIRCTTVSCVWYYSAYSNFYDIKALGWQDGHGYSVCEGATRCVTTGRIYSIDRESSSTGVSKVACGLFKHMRDRRQYMRMHRLTASLRNLLCLACLDYLYACRLTSARVCGPGQPELRQVRFDVRIGV